MTDRQNGRITLRSACFRFGLLALAGAFLLLWLSSYFVGFEGYRSKWALAGGHPVENAIWCVSNSGSIGIAWRLQTGGSVSPLPPDEVEFQSFQGSSSALNNVHPEGLLAWHWIHHCDTAATFMGGTRTEYGHLYLPYWIPFLVIVALLSLTDPHRTRRGSR